MKSVFFLIKFFWLITVIIGIGWAVLPFILANSFNLSWINWFGMITIPSGIATIIIVLIQRNIMKDSF